MVSVALLISIFSDHLKNGEELCIRACFSLSSVHFPRKSS